MAKLQTIERELSTTLIEREEVIRDALLAELALLADVAEPKATFAAYHYLLLQAESNELRLTWAATCSKPRIGEFSGGAVFVTATEIIWNGVSTFII